MKRYGYNYKKHKKDMVAMKYWCDCWLCWSEKKTTKKAVRQKVRSELSYEKRQTKRK